MHFFGRNIGALIKYPRFMLNHLLLNKKKRKNRGACRGVGALAPLFLVIFRAGNG